MEIGQMAMGTMHRWMGIAAVGLALGLGEVGSRDVMAQDRPTESLPVKDSRAADVAAQTLLRDLVDDKPVALWDALPAKFQRDITAAAHKFAGKMDADAWNKAFAVSKKFLAVMKQQKQFVLNHPAILADQKNAGKLAMIYDDVHEMMGYWVESDLSTIERFKKIDLRKLLDEAAGKAMKKLSAISAKADPNDPVAQAKKQISAVKVEMVEPGDDRSTIRITDAQGNAHTLTLVRVDGKWTTQELADGWEFIMLQVNDGIDGITQQQINKAKPVVMGVLAGLDSSLDIMAKAKTQEEFNDAAQVVIATLQQAQKNAGR